MNLFAENGSVMNLVVSETSTMFIYQEANVKWSAKLDFLPICIKRAYFVETPGVIALLSQTGYLQFCYLGTDPIIFSAPPLKHKELDFEEAEEELAVLNKIIKSSITGKLLFNLL